MEVQIAELNIQSMFNGGKTDSSKILFKPYPVQVSAEGSHGLMEPPCPVSVLGTEAELLSSRSPHLLSLSPPSWNSVSPIFATTASTRQGLLEVGRGGEALALGGAASTAKASLGGGRAGRLRELSCRAGSSVGAGAGRQEDGYDENQSSVWKVCSGAYRKLAAEAVGLRSCLGPQMPACQVGPCQ